MNGVDFLRTNPVLTGMQQAQQIDMGRARSNLLDMQVEGERQKAQNERAATSALNRIYAEGGDVSTEGINRRLAADPSLGGARRLKALGDAEQAGQRRTQIEAQARERDARSFKLYLEQGMDAAAADLARKMGLNIPPSFWSDRTQRQALLNKLEVQEKQARINQSNSAAGASRALAQSRAVPDYDEYTDDQNRIVRVDKKSGKAAFVMGPDGQPMKAQNTKVDVAKVQQEGANTRNAATNASREAVAETHAESRESVAETRAQGGGRGAGGRPLNIEARRQMLIDAGVEPREAALIAAGGGITPAQRAGIRQRIQQSVATAKDATGRPQFRTTQDQQAEVARREAEVFGEQSGGAPQAQQQGGAIPQVNGMPVPRSLAERDTLPAGTRYVDPNGQVRVKR